MDFLQLKADIVHSNLYVQLPSLSCGEREEQIIIYVLFGAISRCPEFLCYHVLHKLPEPSFTIFYALRYIIQSL